MENPTPEPSPEILPPSNPAPAEPQPSSSSEPEATPVAAEASAQPEEPTDPLLALARAAKAARLAPADEDRAVTLLKERLVAGRAGITAAVPAMTEGLPWAVAVNAVSAVWESLSLVMRRHLLAAIAKTETEPARRLRLSLARGLCKIDPPAGLKLAAAAAAALKDPETGALSGKHRQYFFNVFIGKGKPWLLQLPLGDLKAADADALVHAAVECFSFCPPFSQLSIVRWVHGGGRFKKIAEGDLATIVKGLSRWNAKLQRQLKAEIAELPPELEAVLKPEALKPAPAQEAAEKPSADQTEGAPETAPAAETADAAESDQSAEAEAPQGEAQPAAEQPERPAREERPRDQRRQDRQDRQDRRKQEQEARREARDQREQREPREQRDQREPLRGNRPFDAKEALRAVEGYINGLRSELENTKSQLHRQEKQRPSRAARPEDQLPAEEVEALRRHNIRLEATVAELRAELEDLASNHEAVAESRLLHTAEPLAEDNVGALKALLGIKLQEAFETYHAMRLEPLDKVFRLDYRDLLGSVFDVLLDQGVPLKKEPPKP